MEKKKKKFIITVKPIEFELTNGYRLLPHPKELGLNPKKKRKLK